MVKKHLSTIILVLIFIAGLSVVLYPTISDYLNYRKQTKTITHYIQTVSKMDENYIEGLFEQAYAYNDRMKAQGKIDNFDGKALSGYEEVLDITGTGIMGYISIPRINVDLPVYHGTSEGVLQIAVGHLEGSSLPVGGDSTHCVLSGHRGLPSARLFTNLDRLEEHDVFTITILDRVLTYEIDQIRVVEPSKISDLRISEGKDYCTLLTCTPYGINTHRLLVRGKRVADPEKGSQIYIMADAYKMDTRTVAVMMAIPLTVLIVLGLIVNAKMNKRRNQETAEFLSEEIGLEQKDDE